MDARPTENQCKDPHPDLNIDRAQLQALFCQAVQAKSPLPSVQQLPDWTIEQRQMIRWG